MKLKIATCGLMGMLLLTASGCGTKDTPQTQQNNQTQSTGQTTHKDSANSKTKNQTDKTQSTKKDQSNTNSGDKQNNSNSNQSNSGQTDTNSQGNANATSAPQTEKQALQQIQSALNTKVPVMLPISVPIAQGSYLTATTTSQKWYYRTQLFQTSKPANINSQAASNGTPTATVEGTEYVSSAKAKNAVGGYVKVDTSQNKSVDLGHHIRAISEGAAGHAYMLWNEGRWSIKMDSPNDPNYKAKNYKDSKQIAKNIVAYLHNYALPAPEKIGVINVRLWKNSLKTTVHWQYHEMDYQVTSKDPLTAIKTATAMKFEH